MAVSYAYPIAGATAPTAAQSALQSVVTAQVVFTDGDTTQIVTHNWNLTATQLAALFPFVEVRRISNGTLFSSILVALTDSNNVTLSKASAVGSAFTAAVVIQRPHSILAHIA